MKFSSASTWNMENRVHRLDRRRLVGTRPRRSPRGRPTAEGRRLRRSTSRSRRCSSAPSARCGSRSTSSTCCGFRSTKNWRLNERHYGALQGLNKARDRGEARRRSRSRSGGAATTSRRRRSTLDDPRHPSRTRATGARHRRELPLDRIAEGHGRALSAVLARDNRARRSARASA